MQVVHYSSVDYFFAEHWFSKFLGITVNGRGAMPEGSFVGGDIFSVMRKARDSGILKSVDRLVEQCSGRGKGASAMDLLIEAAPGDDGGGGDGGKRLKHKHSTRLYLLVVRKRAVSMARVVVYSSVCPCESGRKVGVEDMVGVVSAVVTDEKHRGKGFAKSVMTNVLADTYPMNLRLESEGAAKDLYRALGFVGRPRSKQMVLKNRGKEFWMIDM